MDREDRRRYFVVGSVFIEVVTPILQQRIKDDQTFRAFSTLQAYLNNNQTKHLLFHLRHMNVLCCKDSNKCINNGSQALNNWHWNLLYSKTPGECNRNCHCKYTAKPVQLADPDIGLSCIILLNCCNLTAVEYDTIQNLRQLRNKFMGHNTQGAITSYEYISVMIDLTSYVKQLDRTKMYNLPRIENRPLDEPLYQYYNATLLNVHQKLDEICTLISGLDDNIQRIDSTTNITGNTVQGTESTVNRINQSIKGTSTAVMEVQASIKDLLYNTRRGLPSICSAANCQEQDNIDRNRKKYYKLGQSGIFTQHHQTDLISAVGNDSIGYVSCLVMMDDGRLVICFPWKEILLICNTDESQVESIRVPRSPWCVTAVNITTVAVTQVYSKCIEMYDINNKLKLKSITMYYMCWENNLTTINNKLVVGGYCQLMVLDNETGDVSETIKTDCNPCVLHGSGDKIFYCTYKDKNNNLYWYSYSDDKHHNLTFQSPPRCMTLLRDGCMCVVCDDGAIHHVSFDGIKYKVVKAFQTDPNYGEAHLHYNIIQRLLVIIQNKIAKVFNEI
ncbi:Hypothetical predicted protein [Mytilus galloprovincialis]|uniref:DZIP3-like HEPN domain-containing protein n=1 Tax=Mytilus galloprovincialis TaxID=29158 RepID=A0A8B6C4W5_MYTGA|nr:Hypothetical predicted protein [Mytilus galloprovincialis]